MPDGARIGKLVSMTADIALTHERLFEDTRGLLAELTGCDASALTPHEVLAALEARLEDANELEAVFIAPLLAELRPLLVVN